MDKTLEIGGYIATITHPQGTLDCTVTKPEDGLWIAALTLHTDTPVRPELRITWSEPDIDMQGHWHCEPGNDRRIVPDWNAPVSAYITAGAPVYSLYNQESCNRLTFALSDTLNPSELTAGVREENAHMICIAAIRPGAGSETTQYTLELRIDRRTLPFGDCLADVATWWAATPDNTPAFVPEAARRPMYSTWYSFHQRTLPDEMLAELKLARAMGCEAVIVDDGWQTDDNNRGYAYCGDWQLATAKIPDMRAFSDAVHALDMKIMIWYSVPFVGRNSKAWEQFHDMLLDEHPGDTASLDPRFPQVREYLIQTYETAVRDWDLDGLKLDFVDVYAGFVNQTRPDSRHDIPDLCAAVDRLLSQTMQRLRALREDILIEFRQSYVGPRMRTFGNMFRATDCPNDAITNRRRIADLRLLSGNTAVHSDMLMWHNDEPVETAALQLINILFSVPQVSVLIARLPEEHREMLRFYTDFWNRYRDVLLDGRFTPLHPELSYPVLTGTTADKQLSCVYGRHIVPLDTGLDTLILVNGSHYPYVLVEAAGAADWNVTVTDCRGHVLSNEFVQSDTGIAQIEIPLGGVWTARKVSERGAET